MTSDDNENLVLFSQSQNYLILDFTTQLTRTRIQQFPDEDGTFALKE